MKADTVPSPPPVGCTATDSEKLRAASARYRAHNDTLSPPQSVEERTRKHLSLARRHIARSVGYAVSKKPVQEIVELRAAVVSMLAVLEGK